MAISTTGAKFKLIPSSSKIWLFKIVSSEISENPPSWYNSLGDLKGVSTKFLLLLIRLTVPPSSSTAINKGILALSW